MFEFCLFSLRNHVITRIVQIKKFPCLFSFHVNHVNTSFCCAVSQVIKLLFYYRSFNEIRIRFKTNFVNFEQLLH